MATSMCKKTKEKRKKINSKSPRYKCTKCSHKAHKKKHLCKPKKNTVML